MVMNINVFGDSFAVDKKGWISDLKYPSSVWANRGSSQYRIYKDFKKHYNVDSINIVCCTHYSRVYLKNCLSTTLRQLVTHSLSDWVWNHAHISKDPLLKKVKEIYDDGYQQDIFELIYNEIKTHKNTITISAWNDCVEPDICFSDIWQKFPGSINHLSVQGNKSLSDKINELL